jgi:nitroimidazol reductase NimA-like FMN-containing flavoprotein (pyridoxamine 5'-phosphate oxidase superfamily)
MDTATGLAEELASDECFRLLQTAQVGRLALTQQALPVVIPVNFALDRRTVVIRTGPGSILTAAQPPGVVVAFEVDELDRETYSGWSVLVTGTMREVTDASEVVRLSQLALLPWVGGERRHFVRVTPGLISGRRIQPRASQPRDV